MKFKLISRSIILSLIFLFAVILQAQAEEFEVIQSFKGLYDATKLSKKLNIAIDLSYYTDEEKKVKSIAAKIIKMELEDKDTYTKAIYVLDSKKKVDGMWYFIYKWEFASEVKAGKRLNRSFGLKVDLDNKTVIYNRNMDEQGQLSVIGPNS